MHMSAKRIGLFGLFGSGNIGNDGSLEAMLAFLRSALPDAKLVCVCSGAAKVQREFHIPTIRIGGEPATDPILRVLERLPPARKLLQWLRAFRAVRGLDALIVPGTGILDDYGEDFWGIPATLLGWCLAARLRGAKVAFVCVGAGPIDHPVSRLLMKTAARLAHYRSYRDPISKDFMESIGFDTRNDPVCRDIAFRLPLPACTSAAAGESLSLTVGLGVMTYFGWRGDPVGGAAIYDGYLRKITRFTLWLLDGGHRVRILMGEDSDQKAVDDLLKAIAAERPDYPRERVVAEPAQSLRELMQQIAETQVVVATRYHNIVCALKLGKPAISIGYAKKNDVLMADMGLGELSQHVERFDVDLLIEQFTRLVSSRADYEESMRAANADFRRRLADQEKILLERVLR
ncbi:MAG: polysaccharide pyruvyl transferase family protein [Hyphomicrobiaceae bacterium]